MWMPLNLQHTLSEHSCTFIVMLWGIAGCSILRYSKVFQTCIFTTWPISLTINTQLRRKYIIWPPFLMHSKAIIQVNFTQLLLQICCFFVCLILLLVGWRLISLYCKFAIFLILFTGITFGNNNKFRLNFHLRTEPRTEYMYPTIPGSMVVKVDDHLACTANMKRLLALWLVMMK